MKIKNALFTLLFLLSMGINPLTAQNDFRKTNWGISPAEVKASESCKIFSEESKKLTFDCPLAGLNGKLIYTFSNSGKLMRSKYFITPSYINMNYYIVDYNMFVELLTEKYGKHQKKSVVTTTGKASIQDYEWAAYLSNRELRVEMTWDHENTTITLVLSKVGDNPAIQIDYISKEFSDIDLREKKEQLAKMIK